MFLISPEQIRASRAVLRWSYEDLAKYSGVSKSTLVRIENSDGLLNYKVETVNKIKMALESTGSIVFPDSNTIIVK